MRRGIAEISGVPRTVTRAFSRRKAEIDAALAERGTSGARAAEAAALATRRAKDPRVVAEALTREWRTRAEALGFGERELGLVVGRWQRRTLLETRDWQAAMDHLAGPDGLTRHAATFNRSEVLQGLCEALPRGSQVDAHELERACDQFLATRAVPLIPDGETRLAGETFRRRDGRVLPAGADRLRYSTPEHRALERDLVDRAVAAVGSRAGVAVAAVVDAVVAARPTLSPDQRRVIETLCMCGDGVAVVAGKAGAGKTLALGAAREAWQEAGYPVLGAAVARRAANELTEGAGIQSTSVAALLNDLHGGGGLPGRCVLVVDEAGMLATRQLAELLGHVEQSQGKLVLVGDHRQLPEIGAGGSFIGLVRRGLAVELGENLRQVNAWEREALDQLRSGGADSALELYLRHGALAIEPSERGTRDRLVREWLASAPGEDAVMIAQRRADVADLNERARGHLRDAGELGGVELALPGGAFAVGDAVVIKRNVHRLGVANGQRGRVTGVDPAARVLTVKVGDTDIRLDRAFLDDVTRSGDPTLLHGYAITGHVAQGTTVDRSFVLVGQGISSEWAYVALSRGRLANRLYVSADAAAEREEFAPAEQGGREPLERLAAALRTSSAQVLAIDSGSSAVADRGRDASDAAEHRHALETRKLRWLPGRRRELERARRDERAAIGELRRVQRAEAERLHATRRFVSEQDRAAGADATLDLLADRATERSDAAACSVGSSDGGQGRCAPTPAGAPLHAHAPRSRGGARDQPQPLRAPCPARTEGRRVRPTDPDPGQRARALGPAARALPCRATDVLNERSRLRALAVRPGAPRRRSTSTRSRSRASGSARSRLATTCYAVES